MDVATKKAFMIYFIFFIITCYVLLLAAMLFGVHRIPKPKIEKKQVAHFSIIIPFKDEAENLPLLLDSFRLLDYPKNKYEILMVDDQSTDHSVEIIKQYTDLPIKILSSNKRTNSPKKEALLLGIKQAKFDWIITTDADCKVPIDWLNAYDSLLSRTTAKMILAPVAFFEEHSFLSQFQQIEFLSLQVMTMGSLGLKKPFLSNGANLGFEKQAFFEVDAYKGNTQLASGDDVFLLEKFQQKYPEKIHFLKTKGAMVQTKVQKNLKDLIQQKIRWGSKTRHFQSFLPKFIGFWIFFTNFLLIFSVFLTFYKIEYSLFILIKFLADAFYIKYVNQLYRIRIYPLYFLATFIFYPFWLLLIGFLSLRTGFEWKGRVYKS